MRRRGRPGKVEESRSLGREAVLELLRLAKGTAGAVLDSTWFPYTEPLVRTLPGQLVEVRCLVPVEVARQRYRSRSRDPGHFDELRTERGVVGRTGRTARRRAADRGRYRSVSVDMLRGRVKRVEPGDLTRGTSVHTTDTRTEMPGHMQAVR